jgi:hypothetical protein
MKTNTRDIELDWAERATRVARSQARTDVSGMTRGYRDPDEREFLALTNQLGPFVEVVVPVVGFRTP